MRIALTAALLLALTLSALAQYVPIRHEQHVVASNIPDLGKVEPPSFPRFGWLMRGNTGEQIVDVNQFDWSSSADSVRRLLILMADSTKIVHGNLSRALTDLGRVFADSVEARAPGRVMKHYFRFDHAQATQDSSADLAGTGGAGPVEFWASTVGRQFPAYNTDSPRELSYIWPNFLHWNHWRDRRPWETFDQTTNFQFADSLAQAFSARGTRPDWPANVPVDVVFVDFLADAMNVYDPITDSYTTSDIDYDDDGNPEYAPWSWQAGSEEIRDSYIDWQAHWLGVMSRFLKNTWFAPNGNWGGDRENVWTAASDTSAYGLKPSNPVPSEGFAKFIPYIDGWNFECNGSRSSYSKGFDNFGRDTPYDSIVVAAWMYDTLGWQWVTLSNPCGGTAISGETAWRREAKTAIGYSLLAASNMMFKSQGAGLDKLDEAGWVLNEAHKYNGIGEPTSALRTTLSANTDTITAARDFTNGAVWMKFNANGAFAGFPVSPDSTFIEITP